MNGATSSYFGLVGPPFGSPGDPGRLFRTPAHDRLIESVVADARAGRTVIAVRGRPGIGKTSMLRALVPAFKAHGIRAVLLPGTLQSPVEVQDHIGRAAGIEAAGLSPDQLLRSLSAGSGRSRSGVDQLALLVDDTQACPLAIIRYLWFLVGLARGGDSRIHLVLAGPLGRWRNFDHPDLEELREAAFSHNVISPLDADETAAYLDHKLKETGRSLRQVFTEGAVAELFEQSQGIPARIEAVTERALQLGFSNRQKRIPARTIRLIVPDDGLAALPARRWPWQTGVFACAALCAAVLGGFAWHNHSAASRRLTVALRPPITAAIVPQPPDATRDRMLPEAAAQPPPVETAVTPPPDTAANRAAEVLRAEAATAPVEGRAPGIALLAMAGDTMPGLYAKIYRGLTPPPYDEVVALNPQGVRSGTLVVFPEPPGGWVPRP